MSAGHSARQVFDLPEPTPLVVTEHRAHVLGAFIFLPLLLCPLMHMFMHGGHGGHGAPSQSDRERTTP